MDERYIYGKEENELMESIVNEILNLKTVRKKFNALEADKIRYSEWKKWLYDLLDEKEIIDVEDVLNYLKIKQDPVDDNKEMAWLGIILPIVATMLASIGAVANLLFPKMVDTFLAMATTYVKNITLQQYAGLVENVYIKTIDVLNNNTLKIDIIILIIIGIIVIANMIGKSRDKMKAKFYKNLIKELGDYIEHKNVSQKKIVRKLGKKHKKKLKVND